MTTTRQATAFRCHRCGGLAFVSAVNVTMGGLLALVNRDEVTTLVADEPGVLIGVVTDCQTCHYGSPEVLYHRPDDKPKK